MNPVSRAEDQPWSPFPVQDWSTLPEDPLAYTAVDPSWAPPRTGRPWWLPLVVLAVVGALIGGATFAWNTDGSAVYEVLETSRGSATERSSQVTESARFRGVTGLLSTDSAFGSK